MNTTTTSQSSDMTRVVGEIGYRAGYVSDAAAEMMHRLGDVSVTDGAGHQLRRLADALIAVGDIDTEAATRLEVI